MASWSSCSAIRLSKRMRLVRLRRHEDYLRLLFRRLRLWGRFKLLHYLLHVLLLHLFLILLQFVESFLEFVVELFGFLRLLLLVLTCNSVNDLLLTLNLAPDLVDIWFRKRRGQLGRLSQF